MRLLALLAVLLFFIAMFGCIKTSKEHSSCHFGGTKTTICKKEYSQ